MTNTTIRTEFYMNIFTGTVQSAQDWIDDQGEDVLESLERVMKDKDGSWTEWKGE